MNRRVKILKGIGASGYQQYRLEDRRSGISREKTPKHIRVIHPFGIRGGD
jgi:hypothetical protein